MPTTTWPVEGSNPEPMDDTTAVNVQDAIDKIAMSLGCKFCGKILMEPHVTACGHTFCYVCLKIMLLIILEPGRNISCPLCRVPITTKPIPNHQLKEVITSHVDTLHPTLNKIYSQLLKQAEETFADDERHGTLFNGVFKSPVQAPLYIEQLNPHKSEANHDAGDKEHAPAKEWWQGLSYKELRARDPIAFGKCPRCLSRLYWGVCSEWLCGYGQ